MADIQEIFRTDADASHETGDVLQSGGQDPAVSVLMACQIIHDSLDNIRDIVGKTAVEDNQVCVKCIDQIVDPDRHIFHKSSIISTASGIFPDSL